MSEDRATYQTAQLAALQEAIRLEIIGLSNVDLLEKTIELARTPDNWAFEVAKQELNRRLDSWFKEEKR